MCIRDRLQILLATGASPTTLNGQASSFIYRIATLTTTVSYTHLLRGDQTEIFSNLTHLRFFQCADREQALRNLLMAERIKEVALVFIAVQATQQAALAIDICPTDVYKRQT